MSDTKFRMHDKIADFCFSSQMYIVPNTEKGIVNWMEAVTDEQYNSN